MHEHCRAAVSLLQRVFARSLTLDAAGLPHYPVHKTGRFSASDEYYDQIASALVQRPYLTLCHSKAC